MTNQHITIPSFNLHSPFIHPKRQETNFGPNNKNIKGKTILRKTIKEKGQKKGEGVRLRGEAML